MRKKILPLLVLCFSAAFISCAAVKPGMKTADSNPLTLRLPNLNFDENSFIFSDDENLLNDDAIEYLSDELRTNILKTDGEKAGTLKIDVMFQYNRTDKFDWINNIPEELYIIVMPFVLLGVPFDTWDAGAQLEFLIYDNSGRLVRRTGAGEMEAFSINVYGYPPETSIRGRRAMFRALRKSMESLKTRLEKEAPGILQDL